MLSELLIEICPETGICSMVRGDARKIDLMPDEVEAIRDTNGNAEAITAIIAESDRDFAAGLTPEDIAAIGRKLY